MSLDSDPEIDAAFNGSADTSTPHSVSDDPEISAAFKSSKTAPDVISSRHAIGDEKTAPDVISSRHAIGDELVQSVVAGLSSTLHSVIGGYKGLYSLATTRDIDKAAKAVTDEQDKAYTYSPPAQIPSKFGPQSTQAVAAANAPVPSTILGDFAAQHGASPGLSAALATVPTAASFMAVPKGLGPKASTATAQEVADAAAARQSGGAAGAAPNVSQASPSIQQAIADTKPGNVNLTALQNHLEADAHGVQLTKGQATRDPIQFSNEQNTTHPDVVTRLNAQNGQMIDAIDNIRREASPTTVGNDAIDNGQTVVDSLKAYDEPVKADIQAKYKALADAGGGKIPVNGKLFAENADAALTRDNNDVFLPPSIRTIIDRAAGAEGGFTYNNFENMRTQLATAARSATDGNVRSAVNTVRNELEQLPMTETAGPIKDLADQARSAAKARFDARDADPAYDAAISDVENGVKKGQPSPLADRFLDKYALGTAPKANVDLMTSKLDADAQGAVASHTLNAIRKGAVNANGQILPNGYNGALQKYAPKLDSLVSPDTQDSLESLGRVITNAKVAPPGAFVNYSKSGVIGNAARGLGEGYANAKTGGLYGIGKDLLKGRAVNKFAEDALRPGAGIDKTQ
jgi:hypothetical protein